MHSQSRPPSSRLPRWRVVLRRFAPSLCQLWFACTDTAHTRTFTVDVLAESEPGVPLAGAAVQHAQRERGRTGTDGKLRLALVGREGETANLRVVCPDGHAPPDAPIRVALRSLASTSAVPRYKALCPPLLRSLVVAVRAQQGANLPLRYRGREVARTDATGAAHVLLKVPPKDAVSLVLDTSTDAQLRPKSPELSLDMPAEDKLVLFDKTFHREVREIRRATKPLRANTGPRPMPITSR